LFLFFLFFFAFSSSAPRWDFSCSPPLSSSCSFSAVSLFVVCLRRVPCLVRFACFHRTPAKLNFVSVHSVASPPLKQTLRRNDPICLSSRKAETWRHAIMRSASSWLVKVVLANRFVFKLSDSSCSCSSFSPSSVFSSSISYSKCYCSCLANVLSFVCLFVCSLLFGVLCIIFFF